MEELSKSGNKHVPVDLALIIAQAVASALEELHTKHIIHRDIKSENVLVDLESKQPDRTPVVKLCDFDQAVPLRSSSHTCCIAHTGIHPPNACVGTPRWMAPEVLQAMEKPKPYGLVSLHLKSSNHCTCDWVGMVAVSTISPQVSLEIVSELIKGVDIPIAGS